jgi:hypothetical protein
MSEVYDKAVDAIAEVGKAEEAEQHEPPVTVTMPCSAMLVTMLAVQLGVKSVEDNINSAVRNRSLPSDFDRQELKRLRIALELLIAAFKSGDAGEHVKG